MRRAALLVLLLAGCDCNAARPEVIVELKTDFRPGLEFDRVETFLYRGTSMADVLGHVDEVATDGEDYLEGVRVASLRASKNGTHRLRVRIWSGERIRGQTVVHVNVSGTTIVRVIITRSCENVMCPIEGGDAFAVSCLGGRCVTPECAVEDPPPECAPQCTIAPDCPASPTDCGAPRCIGGVCLLVADDSRCSADTFCVPEVGCVRLDMMDAGTGIDAGGDDAGADAGGMDAAGMDSGPPDGGPPDAGPLDGGPADAGPRDAGRRDAGRDGGGPTVPDGGGCPGSCDDFNVCTNDFCMTGLCFNMPNTSMCDDGDDCTVLDRCGMGICSGPPRPCNDTNPCTTDSCAPGVGCVFAPNTLACDDMSLCTTGDRCSGGTCTGTRITCDDGNPCTTDGCGPATGCTFTNNTSLCNDGNPCTFMDRCSAGACTPGGPVPEGTPCDDGLYCNGPDVCMAGTCTHNPVMCAMAGTTCHEPTDSCVPCGMEGQPCCGRMMPGLCVDPFTCCVATGTCESVCAM